MFYLFCLYLKNITVRFLKNYRCSYFFNQYLHTHYIPTRKENIVPNKLVGASNG